MWKLDVCGSFFPNPAKPCKPAMSAKLQLMYLCQGEVCGDFSVEHCMARAEF